MMNVMLMHSELPLNLWGEALLSVFHIINRITLKKTGISPYEAWKGRAPNVDYFKVWGCVAYYKNMDPKRTKLGPREIRWGFVEYAQNSKAYRLLNLETNVIIESRNVEFFENHITKDKESESAATKESCGKDSSQIVEIQPEGASRIIESQPEPRMSKRVWKTKNLGPDEIDPQFISFYLVEGNFKNFVQSISAILQIGDDPKTYKEAITSRESSF